MKVRVKLFGPLSGMIPEYNPGQELEIQLPDGAVIDDIFSHLGIPEPEGYMVTMDNTVINPLHIIKNGSVLSILPQLAGG